MKRFLRDIGGATAIEYAVLASMIGVVIVGGLIALDDRMLQHWERIVDDIATLEARSE